MDGKPSFSNDALLAALANPARELLSFLLFHSASTSSSFRFSFFFLLSRFLWKGSFICFASRILDETRVARWLLIEDALELPSKRLLRRISHRRWPTWLSSSPWASSVFFFSLFFLSESPSSCVSYLATVYRDVVVIVDTFEPPSRYTLNSWRRLFFISIFSHKNRNICIFFLFKKRIVGWASSSLGKAKFTKDECACVCVCARVCVR